MVIENFERDIDWLLEKNPGASHGEQEAFAEKVAKLCYEGFVESEARSVAYAQLYATSCLNTLREFYEEYKQKGK